ncbi:MAG: GNAT family N-acetyltransferase [Otoolea sp.]|nr:N-acetyltransferase family protein [Clostridiaceae bacterium]MDD6074379.1 GNAT family N-acetyltransferase [Clostridium sp.]MDY5484929.1 N-acetyltransferase family protein [Clostridium sp.]
MRIRWAEEADLPRLTEIFNYEVENTTVSFCITPQTLKERERWFKAHNRENRPMIVAEEDGEAVGFACLSEYRVYEAYNATAELSVYVDHRYRHRGIGEQLMRRVIELAKQNGKIHVIISVITGDNVPSIRLHEKLGFSYGGISHEVGFKFGAYRDVVYYEYMIENGKKQETEPEQKNRMEG